MGGAEPFDGGQPRRHVAADVDDDQVGNRLVTGGTPILEQADGHAAGAEDLTDLAFELVVLGDDERCKLGHVLLLHEANGLGEGTVGAGPPLPFTSPEIGVMRP